MSEKIMENEEDRIILFHGKDVRSKKFQKKINRKSKSSLFRVVIINAGILIGLIMIIFLLVNTIN